MYCPDSEGKMPPLMRTSDYFRTCNLPKRFEYPSWFHGYGVHREPPQHPFYTTSNGEYGRYPPTIHTVPTSFFPNNQEFSKAEGPAGNYRNYSLNTGIDQSVV